MIPQYLGSDLFKLYLTSGKEIELTEDEITEIVNENITIKTKIEKLENDVSKYHDLYTKSTDKLEENRSILRLLSKTLNDHTLTTNERLVLLVEQLEIK
jgi:hypothetical protein